MRLPIMILLYFYLCLCLGAKATAQKNSDPEALIAKALELAASNPVQAIKIGEHLTKNASSDLQRCDIALLMAISWYNKGQYGNSLTASFLAKELAVSGELKDQLAAATIFIASNLRILKLEGQSKRYLSIARRDLNFEGKSATKNHLLTGYLNQTALLAAESGNYGLSLRILSNSKKIAGKFPVQNHNNLSETFFITGKVKLAQKQYKLAIASFLKGMEVLPENNRYSIHYLLIANELAGAYFQQKKHQEAIRLLQDALPVSEKMEHIRLQESINRNLALNYLALKNRELYLFYNKRHLTLDDVADTLESESTSVAFSLISLDQETAYKSSKVLFVKYAYILLGAAILAILCLALVFLRNKSRINRLREILKYLQREKTITDLAPITDKKEPPRHLTIPAETEQYLLGRLKKFELSGRFTSKEMSLAVLAAEFNTNTKYLSEIINKHSSENFNTYINKLRIAYIVDKIKHQPKYRNYKIKYLADESGFSSHSSFATTFKSITGISPTTFIELLSDDRLENTATK